jgi:membrane protein insertase Oxa1/YidC/SpoIIIJ
MKNKILFWSAVLFFVLGLNTKDGILYYFFSIHLIMLFIGILIHTYANKPKANGNIEPLPATEPAEK